MPPTFTDSGRKVRRPRLTLSTQPDRPPPPVVVSVSADEEAAVVVDLLGSTSIRVVGIRRAVTGVQR